MRKPRWESWEEERLLELPVARLGLRIEKSLLEVRLARLYAELQAKGISFRPRVWLSSSFFSPDDDPGIAVPFQLAHPRLVRLERSQMGWAEGAGSAACMRLLRHEAGHAVDTAFGLSRRSDWRAAFGLRSAPYRQRFSANPDSGDHVQYLPRWYAQSHPAEDFAETFAVWLDPGSRWRSRYSTRGPRAGARSKLELVDRMLTEVRGLRVRGRSPAGAPRLARLEPAQEILETLGQHYRSRRRRRLKEPSAPYEREWMRAFEATREVTVAAPGGARSPVAAWLEKQRPLLVRRSVGSNPRSDRRRRGCDAYSMHQLIDGMQLYSRERGLRLNPGSAPPRLTEVQALIENAIEELRGQRWRLAR